MMKTIKRLNSLEEIPLEERNKSLDFGYTLFTWFSVRVVVNLESVKVFYKKNGFSEKMIFDIEDPDLDYGIVGIGTFATPVAFDNIMLRPIVNEENPNFSPDDIPPSINPEEDLFFYNLTGNKVNDECGITVEEDVDDDDPNAPSGAGSESGMGSKKGKKKGKGRRKKQRKLNKKLKYEGSLPWAICIFNRRPKRRMKYCKDLFKESPRLRKKCEQDFCNFCCEKKCSLDS